MNTLNLYYVQDSDRPMHVLAVSWKEALTKWTNLIMAENDGDAGDEPQGIQLIAEYSDIIL